MAPMQPPMNDGKADRRNDPPPGSRASRAPDSELFDVAHQNFQIPDIAHLCLKVIHGFVKGRFRIRAKNLCGIPEPLERNPEPVNCQGIRDNDPPAQSDKLQKGRTERTLQGCPDGNPGGRIAHGTLNPAGDGEDRLLHTAGTQLLEPAHNPIAFPPLAQEKDCGKHFKESKLGHQFLRGEDLDLRVTQLTHALEEAFQVLPGYGQLIRIGDRCQQIESGNQPPDGDPKIMNGRLREPCLTDSSLLEEVLPATIQGREETAFRRPHGAGYRALLSGSMAAGSSAGSRPMPASVIHRRRVWC